MKNALRILIVGILSLIATIPLSAQNVVLSGQVTDAETDEPLAGVTVYNTDRRTGTTTNTTGHYTITLPSNRTLELVFSYVGYASETHTLTLMNDLRLDIQLRQDTQSLGEVQVYGSRHNFGVQSSQMSAIAVSAEQIKRMPVLFGETDVLKSLQHLPGVQSSGEGRAGIHVRGGEHDQNLFTLDGITLYNPEHLQGFTSAINSDVLDDVVLYKGAFPARFGTRLSSVVDISLLEGDMERYRASVTAGMLASRVQVEGPIWKGRTSFNIAARASYFNAIVRPLLEEVVYDNPGQMNEFSHMRYYDINAKLTHRLTDRDKLSAVFYLGHDVNNATPNESEQHFQYETVEADPTEKKYGYIDKATTSQTLNNWTNLLGGLNYVHQFSPQMKFDAGISYSGYDYKLSYLTNSTAQTSVAQYYSTKEAAQLYSLENRQSGTAYQSDIHDWTVRSDMNYLWKDRHDIHGGVQMGHIELKPFVDVLNSRYDKKAASQEVALNIGLGESRYTDSRNGIQNQVGGGLALNTLGAYIEDDWDITNALRANMGLRLQDYIFEGGTQMVLEPRLSMRLLFSKSSSLKASYSRMSQGIHQLTSGSLISPSELWVPVCGKMKVGISDQISIGLNHDMKSGIQLSVEGYYKWLDNIVDYQEGTSFQTGSSWEEKIAQGRGRAFGIELMAQKSIGNTTGMVSYTWSKSLCTFNREGMVLNEGRDFYSPADRRHNISINLTQRLSKNWDLSAAWTYQTGRRAFLATMTVGSGVTDEFNNYAPDNNPGDISQNPSYKYYVDDYYIDTYLAHIVRTDTYGHRNAYVMPAIHRLDISLSHHGSVGIGEMICDIGIYNLYNHSNVSTVYWGFQNNRRSLMGVCLFPIMPSLSLTLKL